MVGVAADGAIGNKTLLAIGQFKDVKMLVDEYCDKRLDFLDTLKTCRLSGMWWRRRVADVRESATRMITT
jgi:lysozyme family protein